MDGENRTTSMCSVKLMVCLFKKNLWKFDLSTQRLRFLVNKVDEKAVQAIESLKNNGLLNSCTRSGQVFNWEAENAIIIKVGGNLNTISLHFKTLTFSFYVKTGLYKCHSDQYMVKL